MQNNAITPMRDFISFDDAITLIKGHNREKPTVLAKKLRVSYRYCKPGNNITLFLAKRGITPAGYEGAVEAGIVYVEIKTNLEAELMKQAIKDKIQELQGKEFNPYPTVARTTANEEGNERCLMKNNPKPEAKIGQEIRA